MVKIIGVKFNHTCKVYYFDPKDMGFVKGDGVIVETARGIEYGKVVIDVSEVDDSEIVTPLKPVIRKATKKDEDIVKEHESKVPDIIKVAEKEVEKCGLEMKIVDAEYPFDNSKIIIYFTAPNRIDFRDLVKSLASELKQRIDLRQIGTRDETKILGGLAPCGRVCCCKSFLPDFKKVTIKMAKNQGLSLNPAKISGLCGRLMCCLEYENEPYEEAYKKMPKIGTEVTTPDGKATVISNNMLKMLVKTKTAMKDGSVIYKEYALDEIKFKKP
ncbi:MAG: stage 0 sporulation family protein, partial [Clostridia bacterium]|nr:stage 0 sporulation family protein [Clostridia bacterium]